MLLQRTLREKKQKKKKKKREASLTPTLNFEQIL